MNLKERKVQLPIAILVAIGWIYYYVQELHLFTEVKDFITPGSAYMIQVLEFTNFRGKELSNLLIVYFILISITHILSMYVYRLDQKEDKQMTPIKIGILLVNSVNLIIVVLLANIYWVVYLILAVLSVLVVLASTYVSNLIFSHTVTFSEGDKILLSEAFKTEASAIKSLENKMSRLSKNELKSVSGDIFNIEDDFYFEIHATDTISLNRSGEFFANEKK